MVGGRGRRFPSSGWSWGCIDAMVTKTSTWTRFGYLSHLTWHNTTPRHSAHTGIHYHFMDFMNFMDFLNWTELELHFQTERLRLRLRLDCVWIPFPVPLQYIFIIIACFCLNTVGNDNIRPLLAMILWQNWKYFWKTLAKNSTHTTHWRSKVSRSLLSLSLALSKSFWRPSFEHYGTFSNTLSSYKKFIDIIYYYTYVCVYFFFCFFSLVVQTR